MKFRLVHLFLIGCMGLFNCDSGDKVVSSPVDNVRAENFTFVKFNLASGNPANFPLPNDVLRNPVTGRLAFPASGDPNVNALISQVNTLDGFSTLSFIRIPFDGEVDASTINNNTIRVIDLVELAQAQAGVQVNPVKTMTFNIANDDQGHPQVVDSDETGATVLKMTPVRPLTPGHPHMVIVTNQVLNTYTYTSESQTLTGHLPVESDSVMLALKSRATLTGSAAALEPLRQAYNTRIWPAAEAITGTGRLFIPAAFVFTTATQHQRLQELRGLAQAEHPTTNVVTTAIGSEAVDNVYTLLGLGAAPHSAIGALTTGTFSAPHYISNPLSGYIQSTSNPTHENLRYVATLPLAPSPFGDGTYPVIIYQHGLGSNKETLLAVANTAALAGFATIAIDLVKHGSRSLIGSNGTPLPSGTGFINPLNLLQSRDHVIQSSADLMCLTRLITSGAGDITGDGLTDLNPGAITYASISLGSIVGTSFVTVEPAVGVALLNVPGGNFSHIIQNSIAIGPPIINGLAAAGIVNGTSLYDLYFLFAQALLDDADPANYIAHTRTGALSGGIPTAVLIQEVLDDGVVPNIATEALARALNRPQVDAIRPISGLAQVSSPHYGSGIYQFRSPADIFTRHGALLTPAGGNPTGALQFQMATYLGSALLGNPTIIDPFNGNKLSEQIDIYRGINEEINYDKLIRFEAPQ